MILLFPLRFHDLLLLSFLGEILRPRPAAVVSLPGLLRLLPLPPPLLFQVQKLISLPIITVTPPATPIAIKVAAVSAAAVAIEVAAIDAARACVQPHLVGAPTLATPASMLMPAAAAAGAAAAPTPARSRRQPVLGDDRVAHGQRQEEVEKQGPLLFPWEG